MAVQEKLQEKLTPEGICRVVRGIDVHTGLIMSLHKAFNMHRARNKGWAGLKRKHP